MKKNKIIGLCVAALGVVVSIAGAAALYVRGANETGFGIGQGTFSGHDGTITYKINNATSGTVDPEYCDNNGTARADGGGLDDEYYQLKYTFNLSAAYAGNVIAQVYTLGKLSVSISNIPAKYQGKLAIWAIIEHYTEDSYGAVNYGAIMNSDYAITNEHTSYSYSNHIAVATTQTQSLVIYMKYSGLSKSGLYALDEESLGHSISVTWTKPDNDYQRAFVVGSGNQWTKDDEYAMVPNINKPNAEGFEWMFSNLPGTMLLGKCTHDNGNWSSGDNATLDPAKTYTVYWNGSGSSAASFNANA